MKKAAAKKAVSEQNTDPKLFPTELIEVCSVDPSPVNKRKFIDNDPTLEKLAASIEAQGLMHAIVVRNSPYDNLRFELVSGERRWRAYQLKNWTMIPASIRELTDAEAHDMTASENLNREDLSLIEEAESVQVLLDDGRSAKEVADRIGRSESWVLKRARLSCLSSVWKDAILDPENEFSKWSATHLELIARYDEETQNHLIGDFRYNAAMTTVKDLEKMLNSNMLLLSNAPWKLDDETVHPVIGACVDCQKRTSCAPSLFEPIEDLKVPAGDKCLDRDCWGKKLVEHHKLAIQSKKEKFPSLVLVNNAQHNTCLPDDNPFEKQLLKDDYKYQPTKKSDPAAIPAYVVDGPQAGKVQYLKLRHGYESSPAKKVSLDGKPAQKTLEERREGLEKRRIVRLISKIIALLSGSGVYDEDNDKGNKKPDFRNEIAEKVTILDAFALISSFGATKVFDDENGFEESFEKFERITSVSGSEKENIAKVKTSAVFAVFSKIIDELKQQANIPAQSVTSEFADKVCEVLKLDREELWSAVVSEIPEPNSWAKLADEE
jgi:ParB/RepB/Spo0J family partition protein